MNGKLITQYCPKYCPGVDMKEYFLFLLLSHEMRMLDKSTKKKEEGICKIAIRNAGMKQDEIARVLTCPRVM